MRKVVWPEHNRTTRIERRCPRCHQTNLHPASPTSVQRTLIHGTTPGILLLSADVDVICAGCGHHWVGRLKRDET